MKANRTGRLLLCGAAALCFFGGAVPCAWRGDVAHASMPAWNVTKEAIEAMQGTWYDLDGNVAFVVTGDDFNGRKIVHAMNYAGPRAWVADVFLEGEDGGERVGHSVAWMPSRRFLTVDGKTFRNTREPEYFESVRGVYLGMKEKEMLALMGAPERNAKGHHLAWPDMAVNIEGGIVTAIFLPKGGACLDGSGLGADSDEEAFREAYGIAGDFAETKFLEIGSCHEYLLFAEYPDEIALSLHTP